MLDEDNLYTLVRINERRMPEERGRRTSSLSNTDNIGLDLSTAIYYVGPLCFVKKYLVIGTMAESTIRSLTYRTVKNRRDLFVVTRARESLGRSKRVFATN